MMEKFFPDPCSQQRLFSGPLASYLDGFAAVLAAGGYAKTTLKDKLRLIAHLSRWLQRQGLPLTTLDEQRITQFLADHRCHQIGRGAGATCRRLLTYLRELGSIPPPLEIIDDTPLRRIRPAWIQLALLVHRLLITQENSAASAPRGRI